MITGIKTIPGPTWIVEKIKTRNERKPAAGIEAIIIPKPAKIAWTNATPRTPTATFLIAIFAKSINSTPLDPKVFFAK